MSTSPGLHLAFIPPAVWRVCWPKIADHCHWHRPTCHQPLSAISKYKWNPGHQCSTGGKIQSLDLEDNWHRWRVKEAISIFKGKLLQNRDIGRELPPVSSTISSHAFYRSCEMTVNSVRWRTSSAKWYEIMQKYLLRVIIPHIIIIVIMAYAAITRFWSGFLDTKKQNLKVKYNPWHNPERVYRTFCMVGC